MKVPNHIAIILDGNGRWAKSKGMPRSYGHVKGCENLEDICEVAKELGVKIPYRLCVFHGKLETVPGRSGGADAIIQKLSEKMYQDLPEKSYACAGYRRSYSI